MAKIYTSNTDRIFAALSDPTRRSIIEALQDNPASVQELAAEYDMSLQAVSKHLNVLDRAGLIRRRSEGRFRICTYNPEPMSDALLWMTRQYRFWQQSFENLEQLLNKEAK